MTSKRSNKEDYMDKIEMINKNRWKLNEGDVVGRSKIHSSEIEMYIHYTTGNEAYASDSLKGDIM